MNKKLKKVEMAETNFEGIIAQTTDGGRKFTVQYNSTLTGLNVYFNGIQFVDENNGWAVGVEYSLNSSSSLYSLYYLYLL